MAGVNPYAGPIELADGIGQQEETPVHPKTLSAGRITLSPHRLVHPREDPEGIVSDLLYSGFVEHLGRGIYGGIVDNPDHPSPAHLLEAQEKEGNALTKGRLGWRKDVMKILSKKGELEMPVLRWPGGNYVSNYHWIDGVGPIENRPKRMELAWQGVESNFFGTDEFMDYARALGVEPYICLNMGTGTYEEALSWLEYCNGTGDTYWANLRRKNTGRDEPHGVKYWGLGNEVHGPWQIGHLSATDYTKTASRWAHGLRIIDPTIRLVSCGNQGNSEWDREVLQGLIGIVDMHSIHLYTMLGHQRDPFRAKGYDYEKNVFGPAAAERGIEICTSLIELAKIERSMAGSNFGESGGSIPQRSLKICYDEWNVWDETKAPGSGANGLEQIYDYTDMLGVVAWLHVLLKKHRDIGMANIAQSVNVISPVMTSPDGILLQATYWPLRLFARYMKQGRLLDLGLSSSSDQRYRGPTYPTWIQHIAPPAYVEVLGVLVESEQQGTASYRLSFLNRHPHADWSVNLDLESFGRTTPSSVEVHEVYSDDLTAKNTFERPDIVVPRVSKLTEAQAVKAFFEKPFVVKKHSFSFVIVEVGAAKQ